MDSFYNTLRFQAFVLFIATSLSPAASFADQADDVDDHVSAHLASGEFSVALVLAERVSSGEHRDALLQRIAVSQDHAGARRAANQTLGRIADDQIRTAALNGILAQRFGPADPILAQFGGGPAGGGIGGGIGNGGGGGDSQADFDAIIDLVESTIEPESWDEVGGPGSIAPFEGGVVIDSAGVLHRTPMITSRNHLDTIRRQAAVAQHRHQDVRKASPLRKVSLPQLERALQQRIASGRGPDTSMRLLAGITRIQYVLVYPETHDLVLAGPAGDWQEDGEGRVVNVDSGRPVLRLDDLVVVLRAIVSEPDARFGCSITPTRESLARTRAHVAATSRKPLTPGKPARDRWLEGLRQSMGRQNIEVYGIDPGTRVAQILVEADYRMKRVGMGLEKGTDGMTPYLDSIVVKEGEPVPAMDVLRWWFTLGYDAVGATPARDGFQIRGQGVTLLSENEMLTQLGDRVATGKSDALNRQFAAGFTREFSALAARYPIYADLQNIFDLALVSALIRDHDLAKRAGWQMSCLGDPIQYRVPTGFMPRQVDTIANYRMLNDRRIFAFVSGGVRVDPSRYSRDAKLRTKDAGTIGSARHASRRAAQEKRWWWD